MKNRAPVDSTEVLTCWKDIAQYMGKAVRTVQRWEREFQLPVKRLDDFGYKSAVLARPEDLDSWFRSNWSLRGRSPIAGNGAHPGEIAEIRANIQVHRGLREQQEVLVRELHLSMAALTRKCRELELSRTEILDVWNKRISSSSE